MNSDLWTYIKHYDIIYIHILCGLIPDHLYMSFVNLVLLFDYDIHINLVVLYEDGHV